MGVKWDDTIDRRLLLSTIDPATKPNWEDVAKAMGEDFTSEACRQRFGKLKRDIVGEGVGSLSPKKRKADENNGTGENGEVTTPKKPRKPRAKTPKTPKTPKKVNEVNEGPEPEEAKPVTEEANDTA
ncbi:hypothetical protein AJ80_04714 [Polytolypa hystricis UAMH7299]|uniref:Myb-like domain-containing protein n=1 Tax=Polytolypa hystricis (strain UAMH7299) TaxID=1447883 RepID=A0A2B7Y871_POLH7|nr:hypothetical protein AJ80_04714 [Polytolypa hystricis UAMH7299]